MNGSCSLSGVILIYNAQLVHRLGSLQCYLEDYGHALGALAFLHSLQLDNIEAVYRRMPVH